MIRPNEELTQETSDRYIEQWTVIINKSEYTLNNSQARALHEQIASGSRGIVMFKDFTIPIPYIEEFFLASKELNPKYQLENTGRSEADMEETEWFELKGAQLEKEREEIAKKTS